MSILNWRLFAVVLVFASIVRFWGTFEYQDYGGDEGIIVPATISLITYGTTEDWKYPQLTNLILAGTMNIFGNNSFGWRISGVVLGIASILLVYLIARQLYPDTPVPLLAASLLAFDPFHIHFCRTVMMETPAVFFFLLFLYLILAYCENDRRTLAFAGVALGLAFATKAYFVLAAPVVAIYSFWRVLPRMAKESRSSLLMEFTATLLFLPLSIYILSYSMWFGRGYTLTEFFQFRFDAYWMFNQDYKFVNEQILAFGGKPWEWFVKPLALGHEMFNDGKSGRFLIEINNPLFRMMVLPAIGFVTYHAARKRSVNELIVPLLFAACYILLLIVNRPINSYSSLVLLPFAYMALAHAAVIIAGRYHREKEVTVLFLLAVVVWGGYLFPLTSGFLVSLDMYSPILSITNLTRVF